MRLAETVKLPMDRSIACSGPLCRGMCRAAFCRVALTATRAATQRQRGSLPILRYLELAHSNTGVAPRAARERSQCEISRLLKSLSAAGRLVPAEARPAFHCIAGKSLSASHKNH